MSYLQTAIKEAFLNFKPAPKVSSAEWLSQHAIIPTIVGSPAAGQFDADRVPWLRKLLDLKDQPGTRTISILKSARVGGSLFGILCCLEKIVRRPGPVLIVAPSVAIAERFSRSELQHYLRECKPVWDKAHKGRTDWKVKEMHFRDCQLRLAGSHSASALAGTQAEYLWLTEVEKFAQSVGDEADSVSLAKMRTALFQHTKLILEESTPTVSGGYINQQFLQGSQAYYYVPCPHCQHKQRLTFFSEEKEVFFNEDFKPIKEPRLEKTGNFHFKNCKREDGSYDMEAVAQDTTYQCAKCSKLIEYSQLYQMLRAGEWVHHNPEALRKGHVSVHIWAAYSVFMHWGEVAKEFLLSKDNSSKLHNFWNSYLGLPFERFAAVFKETDIDVLIKNSPEYYLKQIPRKPDIITMHIDVQKDRFYWSVSAHGIDQTQVEKPTWSALIDCGQAINYEQLEEIAGLKQMPNGQYNRYLYNGEDWAVQIGIIDSGFNTQRVYDFCAKHSHMFSPAKGSHTGPLRGARMRLTPIEDNPVQLVMYNDEFYKEELYYAIIKDKKRGWWLPKDTPQDFKEQLVSERTVENNGKLEWKVIGQAGNHFADTMKISLVLSPIVEEVLNCARDDTAF